MIDCIFCFLIAKLDEVPENFFNTHWTASYTLNSNTIVVKSERDNNLVTEVNYSALLASTKI